MHVIAKSNKILVKPDDEVKKTASGLYIPETAKTGNQKKGTIVDLAQMLPDGHDEVHEVHIGDRILYNNSGVIDVEDLHLVPYGSVLLKL